MTLVEKRKVHLAGGRCATFFAFDGTASHAVISSSQPATNAIMIVNMSKMHGAPVNDAGPRYLYNDDVERIELCD